MFFIAYRDKMKTACNSQGHNAKHRGDVHGSRRILSM